MVIKSSSLLALLIPSSNGREYPLQFATVFIQTKIWHSGTWKYWIGFIRTFDHFRVICNRNANEKRKRRRSNERERASKRASRKKRTKAMMTRTSPGVFCASRLIAKRNRSSIARAHSAFSRRFFCNCMRWLMLSFVPTSSWSTLVK